MATLTQANRQFKVTTTLGKDVLLFGHMTATEELSGLFKIDLNLFSEDKSIKPDQILGTPVGVTVQFLEQEGEGERYFHGLCSEFTYVENAGTINVYRATLRPWLWFLTRTADCRIFQKMSVPDIIKTVFREHNFSDFKDGLTRGYEPREYCVQYRETAFDFVSRLMEHEGIYYFHEHTANKHVLVLSDASSSHVQRPGYEKVPFFPPLQTGRRKRDHVSQWWTSWEVQSGEYTHTDYDFEQPSLDLKAGVSEPRSHGHAQEEIYDYPGGYLTHDAGGSLARIRLDERRARYQVAHGVGNARGLAVGYLFALTDYPRDDQNREYLVTSLTCEAAGNDYITGGPSEGESTFDCSFTAISSAEQFRPPRVTPKPFIRGPQTALVVGPAGEEIDTDEYGRIKVQFYWDRHGKKDDNSSCWVRVGQLWASSGWGAMFIPRVGMEVIVDFLEGDPDHPIVTGCVYNGTNKPPYALPGEKTKSTIKSNSSKGGGGSNEMRFEDKKGEEEVYFHAQKDFSRKVEHDDKDYVGNDQVIEIKNNRTETVDEGDEKVTIAKGNRSITVSQGNDTLTVSTGNQSTKISLGSATTEAMQSIELKVGSSSVKIDQSGVTIKGMMIKIDGDAQTEVQGAAMVQVKGGLVQIN